MMSKCSKCGGFSFEIKETSPMNSRYKFLFIQCSSCGVPAGAVEYMNTHTNIQELNLKMKELDNKINSLDYKLSQLITLSKKH